jgi:dipeptidyl aminopeptidase/acylaminoacyl peptidase
LLCSRGASAQAQSAAPSCSPQAQAPSPLTAQDYARAEKLLFWNVSSLFEAGIRHQNSQLIFNADVTPHWLDAETKKTDKFWYRNQTPNEAEFILVDPEKGSRQPAFDHSRLAAALSKASAKSYSANELPFASFNFVDAGRAIQFDLGPDRWTCTLSSYDCQRSGAAPHPSPAEVPSPDGRWSAFLRDHNLFIREVATGKESQLTTDGEKYFDYASSPDSRQTAVSDLVSGKPMPPEVVWSPDSKRLVTYRLDQRKVKELYLVQSVTPNGSVRPILYTFRYPEPGDKDVAMAQFMVFDVETKDKVVLDTPSEIVDYISPIMAQWVWWSEDGARVYFIEKDRGEKTLWLHVADPKSGVTRTIIEEHRSTFVEPGLNPSAPPVVKVLTGSNEIIWFSERDGWGHLYLYDAKTGAVKNQITSGHWVVRELLYVDEANRWVYFAASGREPGRDPYLRRVYRVKLDGSSLQLLTPEDADHLNTQPFTFQSPSPFSPSGRYFVDTYSRADIPPVTVVRSADGKLVRDLEHADASQLLATGWKFPEPFQTKAADGVTDIYGLIYRPSNFDPCKKYPVLDSVYPGPQAIRTTKTFFTDQSNAPAFAELGFIVVTVDGRGTPLRSKAFHDECFGHMGNVGGIDDHIAALRALAAKYPSMDLDRVGIFGHSAGGFAAARAILMYPDFYKVAVASAAGYDQRGYVANWGEKYEGLMNGDNYNEQVTPNLAGNLKGKLLMAFGDMDDNVPPAEAIQMINALINANKDFDVLILPNRNHGFIFDPYFIRKEWDYLVKNVLGAQTPANYQIRDPLK